MFLYMLMQVRDLLEVCFPPLVYSDPPNISLLGKHFLSPDNCPASRVPVVCPLLGSWPPLPTDDLRRHPHASLIHPPRLLLRGPLLLAEGQVPEVHPQHADERFCHNLLPQLLADGRNASDRKVRFEHKILFHFPTLLA